MGRIAEASPFRPLELWPSLRLRGPCNPTDASVHAAEMSPSPMHPQERRDDQEDLALRGLANFILPSVFRGELTTARTVTLMKAVSFCTLIRS